jgi:general secretion pathway protein C
LPAKWLSNSSDVPQRASDALEGALRSLARPEHARRLRRLLAAAFAVWAVVALAQVIWALLPAGDTPLPESAVIINPVELAARSGPGGGQVDIDRLRGWHLFGEAGALTAPEPVVVPDPGAAAREGIEKGAKETRLAVKLRGVVASTEDGLGYAVIEYSSKQDVYAVGDKLPVSGKVELAKVLPRQVVLDNNGTYELLELFEESPLDSQLLQAPPPEQAAAAQPGARQMISGADASELARSYRDRLYQNPQSLADVVTISAVRENGDLQGYRIAPGKQREQFELMGFKPGDLITSVNGIALNDPANTLRLYQTMRSASEAVFELQRDGQPLTMSVSLGEEAAP